MAAAKKTPPASKSKTAAKVTSPAILKSAKSKAAKPAAAPAALLSEAEQEALSKIGTKHDSGKGMTRGIVARGHSVQVEGVLVKPGEEVNLPRDEIQRLRDLGYVVDPDRPAIVRGTGPRFYREDEASKGDKN